jgi:hypothetical protein
MSGTEDEGVGGARDQDDFNGNEARLKRPTLTGGGDAEGAVLGTRKTRNSPVWGPPGPDDFYRRGMRSAPDPSAYENPLIAVMITLYTVRTRSFRGAVSSPRGDTRSP